MITHLIVSRATLYPIRLPQKRELSHCTNFVSLPPAKGGGTAKRSDRVGGIVCTCFQFADYLK